MFILICLYLCIYLSVCLSVYTSIYLLTQKAVLKLQSLIAAVKVVKLAHTAIKFSHIFPCEIQKFHLVPRLVIIRNDVSSEPYVLRSPTEYHSQLNHCRHITKQ